VTTKGQTVYLHFFNNPGRSFCYAEIANKVTGVRLVESGEPLPFRQTSDMRLWIENVPQPLDPIATTVAVEVEGLPRVLTEQTTFWIPGE
jgi:hypothetical protein